MIPVVTLLLACAGGAAAPDDAPEAVAFALDDPAYRFCHEGGADATDAKLWCSELAAIPEDRCPGLHATCAGAPELPPAGCQRGGGGAGGGAGGLASAPEKPSQPWRWEPPELSGFELVAEVLRWALALAVAGGVLVLFRYLMKRFWREPDAEPEVVAHAVEVDTEALDAALPEVPAAPSEDLLGLARRALDDGRPGDAVVLARGAALRALGERGVLRLHRSKTDREYVRSVDAGLRDPLRVVVAWVEVVRFGRRAIGPGDAREALAAAERILRAGVLLLLLLAAPDAAAQTPDRYAPWGDAALHALFSQRGYTVSWRLQPLDTIAADDTDVLLLDVDGVGAPEDWSPLRAWVAAGKVLVVIGDASAGFPELGRAADDDVGSWAVAPWLAADGYAAPRLPEGDGRVWTGHAGEAWVAGDAGDAVVAVSIGEGAVLAFADGRFGTNGALLVPANEALLGDAVYVGQAWRGWPAPTPARVQLATRQLVTSDSQPSNPFESLAKAELLPFVLHLLWFWLLLGVWKGWPFVAPRDPPRAGRERFADHVEALGERFRRTGDSGYAASAYAELVLLRMGPKGLALAAIASGMPRAEAAAFVAELERRVADPAAPADAAADAALVDRLWNVVAHAEGRHRKEEG